jgi:hypothetical protein
VFARSGKILVVLALVLTTGLHWAALQTVAWTTMLAANLTSESFSASVSDTFDGQHLCPICKAIRAAKEKEKKADALALKLKSEYPPQIQQFILAAPEGFEPFVAETFSAAAFPSQPPVPPPRRFFV